MMSRLREFSERYFPERELYVRSKGSVRYVTLSSRSQVLMLAAALAVVLWAVAFTARAFISDTVIASQDQALADASSVYRARIATLEDRYARLEEELRDSEKRLDQAVQRLTESSVARTGPSHVEDVLQGRIEASARRLLEVTEQRDDALKQLEELRLRTLEMEQRLAAAQRTAEERRASLDDFIGTFEQAVSERDKARETVLGLSSEVETLATDIEDIRAHQAQILGQIQEATEASLVQLEEILKKTGIDVDGLVTDIERTYSGEGGPFIPILYKIPDAARGFPLDEEAVAGVLDQLQRVNAIKVALERLPLRDPVRDTYRLSSGFGPRRHPVTGRWAMHSGTDFAAPTGTPVYAPVSGTVIYSGPRGGYGNLVKIRHPFGYETRYAHLSEILVSKGETVTTGQLIAKIGSTGRSTGPHLHYEVRRYGKPVNPWRFIEAGRDVF